MKITKLFFLAIFALICVTGKSQSVYPALKDNLTAQTIVREELEFAGEAYKSNPSPLNERRLDLYMSILDFLNEPTQIKTTTEYALTSGFLNTAVKWDRISDSEAFQLYLTKSWTPDFAYILNKLKL
ncbi:MAG: hypothetical protein IPN15_18685 [Saprospiraceae bacterium]|nr:hypothetical protein [Candidatus Vicinibacter affinis]